MKIKLSIHRITSFIFAVVVPDDYDRSMLFLRVQEYSDSPNKKFRGQSFDLFDFIKWYTAENGDFTYAQDWAGFNVPFQTSIDCYKKLPSKWITEYDIEFLRVLKKIAQQIGSLDCEKAYIIGVDSLNSWTFDHEMCHARYFTNKTYREHANDAIKQIPKKIYHRLRRNLIDLGYANTNFVIHNEMQGYLRGHDWNHPEFSKGVNIRQLHMLHKTLFQS